MLHFWSKVRSLRILDQGSQKQIAATLLEASARLEQMDQRRLQLDLLDIAQRTIAGDSYAWPRIRTD